MAEEKKGVKAKMSEILEGWKNVVFAQLVSLTLIVGVKNVAAL